MNTPGGFTVLKHTLAVRHVTQCDVNCDTYHCSTPCYKMRYQVRYLRLLYTMLQNAMSIAIFIVTVHHIAVCTVAVRHVTQCDANCDIHRCCTPCFNVRCQLRLYVTLNYKMRYRLRYFYRYAVLQIATSKATFTVVVHHVTKCVVNCDLPVLDTVLRNAMLITIFAVDVPHVQK